MPITKGLMSSNTCEWATPQTFYDELDKEFHFTLDPCSTSLNKKCEKHYTKEDDGLTKDWSGEVVFCNPPYGRTIAEWVKKCHLESTKGTTVVMLIPARTDTSYFHDYIYTENTKSVLFVAGYISTMVIEHLSPQWWS